MRKVLLVLLLSTLSSQLSTVFAQEEQNAGELGIKVDGVAFFRDNEYDSDIQEGYTLPGARLTLTATYNPLSVIHLELGAHGLFFNGANKYPCYAYHDIGKWKGNQYQSGVHLLPWLRAQASLGNTTFVLGDIYGDVNHGFITPLYNREQQFSADPEAGFQILSHGKWGRVDAYVNWQSYQFREDTHQEAFTVGALADFKPWHWMRIPVQVVLQHRGGEQDQQQYDNGVQTICNGAVGVNISPFSNPDSRLSAFNLEAEADILGCWQQAGKLWPFNSGLAFHQMVKATLWKDARLQLGCLEAPTDFVSLYGNPFFSTVSIKEKGLTYSTLSTVYADIGYSHTWAESYTLGADLETFLVCPAASATRFAFAAQIYFRFTPYFRILGKKHKSE